MLLQQAGLEPVLQVTCRDRNAIALQSDLLNAAVLKIDNVLCLTGDHVRGATISIQPVFMNLTPQLCFRLSKTGGGSRPVW